MKFKAGDKVKFLHEKGHGRVVAVISAYKIRVELSEGLEIEVSASELVSVGGMPDNIIMESKESPIKGPKKPASKPHAKDEMEVDLHIERLTESYYSMSNVQTLNLQIDHFHDAMQRAINGHIRKIVFIHGVGNGVLRQAIRDQLKRYDGVQFSDGSFQKYGAGATEVRIVSKTKAR